MWFPIFYIKTYQLMLNFMFDDVRNYRKKGNQLPSWHCWQVRHFNLILVLIFCKKQLRVSIQVWNGIWKRCRLGSFINLNGLIKKKPSKKTSFGFKIRNTASISNTIWPPICCAADGVFLCILNLIIFLLQIIKSSMHRNVPFIAQ